jgi:hypothetical protein
MLWRGELCVFRMEGVTGEQESSGLDFFVSFLGNAKKKD